jgi:biotin carboxyl carrier protein
MTAHRRPSRRAYLLITAIAVLLVLFPFLFWYYTWFGRRLSDAEMDRYFADKSKPRRAQHALVQLGERLSARRDVSRWYPRVIEQASSESLELRETAAWIMGRDPKYQPFHETLLRLIQDPHPMVRRNAALSLAAFGDPSGRAELAAMLRPYSIPSPAEGALKYRLKVGDYVNPGTLVARVGDVEVRSPVPGEVRSLERTDGASVHAGDPIAELAPDKDHVWEALRALYIVGQAPDLADVERYARRAPGLPERIERQGMLTRQAILARNPAP